LYARILDCGHARPPSGKLDQTASRSFPGVVNLLLIVLLAGDVEQNPGPFLSPVTQLQLFFG